MPISTFGIDEAGDLYVAEHFPGRIYRLSDGDPVDPGAPVPIQPAHSGNWYDPAQSGHGIQIEILSEQQALIWWFTFDPSGTPAWIGGGGAIIDNVIVIPAYTVIGGRFPPNFDPEQVGFEPWGEIRIRFDGCDSGRAEWDPVAAGYSAGNMPLARATRIAGLSCN